MSSAQEAQDAIAGVDGTDLDGREVRVQVSDGGPRNGGGEGYRGGRNSNGRENNYEGGRGRGGRGGGDSYSGRGGARRNNYGR